MRCVNQMIPPLVMGYVRISSLFRVVVDQTELMSYEQTRKPFIEVHPKACSLRTSLPSLRGQTTRYDTQLKDLLDPKVHL